MGEREETDQAVKSSLPVDDISMPDRITGKRRPSVRGKHHEILSRTTKKPAFAYACLELISDPPSKIGLDDLTVRSYLTSALTQFLGLTGTAIAIDILKVQDRECWIRVPREDLSVVVAATGGWIGGNERNGQISWRIRASGNWLGSLLNSREVEEIWK